MGTETGKKVKRMEGLTGIRGDGVDLGLRLGLRYCGAALLLWRSLGAEEVLDLGEETAGFGMGVAG